MGTASGHLGWVDWDAKIVITTRALRSFAQSAIAVLIAIYLGLQGFSLVQVGTFLTVGSVGAAVAAVVTGVLAVSLWAAARLSRRIGLLNTMVFTYIPSSLFLIAVPFVPEAWMAIALWLLRAFFAQMDVPTSQSYTMAVVALDEQTAMASAATVSRSAGMAAGPSVGTALWTTAGASAPFIVGGVVKIAYDLTLWGMFRRVKPPEEMPGG